MKLSIALSSFLVAALSARKTVYAVDDVDDVYTAADAAADAAIDAADAAADAAEEQQDGQPEQRDLSSSRSCVTQRQARQRIRQFQGAVDAISDVRMMCVCMYEACVPVADATSGRRPIVSTMKLDAICYSNYSVCVCVCLSSSPNWLSSHFYNSSSSRRRRGSLYITLLIGVLEQWR